MGILLCYLKKKKVSAPNILFLFILFFFFPRLVPLYFPSTIPCRFLKICGNFITQDIWTRKRPSSYRISIQNIFCCFAVSFVSVVLLFPFFIYFDGTWNSRYDSRKQILAMSQVCFQETNLGCELLFCLFSFMYCLLGGQGNSCQELRTNLSTIYMSLVDEFFFF